MSESVLQNCTGVEEYPFPHVNIANALSQDYYDELYRTMPSWMVVSGGQPVNSGRRRNYSKAMIESNCTTQWKEFIRYHSSDDFYQEWLYWFGPYVRELLPQVEATYGKLENIKIGKEISVNAFIGMNGPLRSPDSVREAHLDKPDHIANGLLYMADPEDTAGGDFQVYAVEGDPVFESYQDGGVKGGNVKFPQQTVVGTVPYEGNRYGSFLATDKALHGVAIRKRSPLPRTFVGTSFVLTESIIYEKQ
jgi:hypothetical protein